MRFMIFKLALLILQAHHHSIIMRLKEGSDAPTKAACCFPLASLALNFWITLELWSLNTKSPGTRYPGHTRLARVH